MTRIFKFAFDDEQKSYHEDGVNFYFI